MADSDDDFDEAWNNNEVETASDPLKYIAKRINDIEALAIERLAAENITPADLQAINYQAVVGATVICRQDMFTNKLPSDAELPAMIWAACQAVKSVELDINQQSVVVQFLIRGESALRYPEIKDTIIGDYNSERARNAAHARHEEFGEKKKEICAIWAKGNFSTRNDCAEEEAAALGMSIKTARKYLIGTPDPDPWPAKNK